MIDLVENVALLLIADGHEGVSLKRLDSFTGKEGVCVRSLPSTVTRAFMDRMRSVDYVYQIVVRRRSESEAMQECSEIASVLQDAHIPSSNGSYGFWGQDIYTMPQELELSESGFFAWETRIKAHITR